MSISVWIAIAGLGGIAVAGVCAIFHDQIDTRRIEIAIVLLAIAIIVSAIPARFF